MPGSLVELSLAGITPRIVNSLRFFITRRIYPLLLFRHLDDFVRLRDIRSSKHLLGRLVRVPILELFAPGPDWDRLLKK